MWLPCLRKNGRAVSAFRTYIVSLLNITVCLYQIAHHDTQGVYEEPYQGWIKSIKRCILRFHDWEIRDLRFLDDAFLLALVHRKSEYDSVSVHDFG